MSTGFCPECDSKIKLNRDPQEGMKVTCPNCGAYLMVVGLSPIELDWAHDEDDDLDYYDDYEDEDEDFDDYDDFDD